MLLCTAPYVTILWRPHIFAASRAEQAFQDSFPVQQCRPCARLRRSAAQGPYPWSMSLAAACIPYTQRNAALAGQRHETASQDDIVRRCRKRCAQSETLGRRTASTCDRPPSLRHVPRRTVPPGVAGAFCGHSAMRASWDAPRLWPDHVAASCILPRIPVLWRRTRRSRTEGTALQAACAFSSRQHHTFRVRRTTRAVGAFVAGRCHGHRTRHRILGRGAIPNCNRPPQQPYVILSSAYRLGDNEVKVSPFPKTAVPRHQDRKNTPSWAKKAIFCSFGRGTVSIGRRCTFFLSGCSPYAEVQYVVCKGL